MKEKKDEEDFEWTTPTAVRKKYGIKYPQLLSIQLQRFRETYGAENRSRDYPVRKGPAGRKILGLVVTPELDAYLTRLHKKKRVKPRKKKERKGQK